MTIDYPVYGCDEIYKHIKWKCLSCQEKNQPLGIKDGTLKSWKMSLQIMKAYGMYSLNMFTNCKSCDSLVLTSKNMKDLAS